MPDRDLQIRRRADRSFRREQQKAKPESFGSFIGWSIFLILLVALVAVCWMGTYYVFGHPEEPTSYSILKRLNKIEQPRRFVDTAAPRGEFLTGDQLLERFQGMRDSELERESAEMLRDYIRNYENTSRRVAYLTGRFNILDSWQLTNDDIFQSGVVALAQDTDNSKVLIEHIFTAEPRMVEMLHRSMLTGLDIPIKRTYDLSAVINVRRLADGRMVFTAIPLHYPSYTSTSGPGGFSLEPPTALNVGAGLPILDKERIAEADERYTMYLRRTGQAPASQLAALGLPGAASPSANAAAAPANELIRVQPAVSLAGDPPAPDTTAAPDQLPPTPETPVAAAPTPDGVEPVVADRVERAVPVSPVTLEPIAEDTPPAPSPSPTPAPTPEPTPEVPLQPFQQASPSPTPRATPAQAAVASTAGGRWQTYSPGQMPRGRLLGVRETQQMADRGTGGERVYLQGNFVVTASGQNRAVLRSQGGGPLGIGGTQNIRVIVDFPAGSNPPGEGSSVSRGADRPFLITDIKRTADGQVNVHVREITTD